MPSWLVDIATPQMAVIVGGLAAVGLVARKMWPVLRRVSHFMDDWFGEAERPGQPARPGAMERLATVEHGQADQADRVLQVQRSVERIEDQFHSNGGQSLRDRVDAVDKKLSDHLAGQGG